MRKYVDTGPYIDGRIVFNPEDEGLLCRDPDGADVLGGAEWRDARWEIPADREEVLVCTRTKKGVRNIDKGYFALDRWIHRGTAEVTHRMPLPPFPAE